MDCAQSPSASSAERTHIEVLGRTRQTVRRFGRGHHEAALKFGDVFAYALCKSSGEPLLFKGRDFALTDVRLVSLPNGPSGNT